jgi:hypothetical protein
VAEIRFSKNGEDLGRAFTINPQLKSSAFFPAVVLKNAEMLFNFGDLPWKYPPPQVWCFELGCKVLRNAEMLFNFGDLPWKYPPPQVWTVNSWNWGTELVFSNEEFIMAAESPMFEKFPAFAFLSVPQWAMQPNRILFF